MWGWLLGGGEWDVNLLTAGTLLAGGLVAAAVASRLRGSPGATYWFLVAVGFAYLAADEHFGFHERLGVQIDAAGVHIPGFHDIDGLVMVAYAAGALATSFVFRSELRRHPRVVALLIGGAGLTAAAFVLDDFGSNHGVAGWMEERLEWLGAVAFLLAFAVRWRTAHVGGIRPALPPALLGDRWPQPEAGYSSDAISE